MEHSTINELPNELLEMIFDQLNMEELKDVSLVCKRWSELAFIGRRMEHVLLVAKFPWDKDLLQSNRKYRHIKLEETRNDFAHVKELFQAFNVCSLRIRHYRLSDSSLRSILLEVPNLQHLWIYQEPDETNEMIEPLPVMGNLKYLEIECGTSDSSVPWHTIAPCLQGLKMYCKSEAQLEQWRHFSGQLKQVYSTFTGENSFNRFCEMTFPLLEELSMTSLLRFGGYEHDLFEGPKIFRRNASLRRLRLERFFLTKTLVEDITHYSKKLTSLEITSASYSSQLGSLESLSQLPELKHLRLQDLGGYILRGCKALTSLQSLCIENITFDNRGTLGFLEDVFEIAPQLRCLELGYLKVRDRVVHFIFNNFSKLTRLQLTYSEKVSRDGLSGIDRLRHLWYLELNLLATHRLFTSNIPRNKVRCLTLYLVDQYDEDDLLRLPEIFPQLDRLNLISLCKCLHESTVDRLRQFLPTCTIKLYGQFFDNVATEICFRKWPRSEMMPVWEKEWIFRTAYI